MRSKPATINPASWACFTAATSVLAVTSSAGVPRPLAGSPLTLPWKRRDLEAITFLLKMFAEGLQSATSQFHISHVLVLFSHFFFLRSLAVELFAALKPSPPSKFIFVPERPHSTHPLL